MARAFKSKEAINLENEKVQAEQAKPKRKKKGKIAKVFRMFQKGLSIKEMSEKTGLSQQVVRSYKWRTENPEKYRALLNRYYTKRKQKQCAAEAQEKDNGKKNGTE